jgi:hypothetical protein
MPSDSVIKIRGEEYEEVPQISIFTSKYLVEAWEALGRPETPFTESGEKLMSAIIAAWEELYPKDAQEWREVRTRYKNNELSITEQVHQHTGRSLASYPYEVFMMMKKLFPNFKPGERANCMKMIRKFPIFKLANRA